MATHRHPVSGSQLNLWSIPDKAITEKAVHRAESDKREITAIPIASDTTVYDKKPCKESDRLKETVLRAMHGRPLTSLGEILASRRTSTRKKVDDPKRKRGFESAHAYRARMVSAPGSFTFEEFLELLKRYDYKCLCCGSAEDIDADHIISLGRKGSTNDISNIQPLCRSCNIVKAGESVDFRYDICELTDFAKGLQIRAKERRLSDENLLHRSKTGRHGKPDR